MHKGTIKVPSFESEDLVFPIDIDIEGENSRIYLRVGNGGGAAAAAYLCEQIECDPATETAQTVEVLIDRHLHYIENGYFVNWVIEDMYKNNCLRSQLTSSLLPDAGMIIYDVIRRHNIEKTLEVGLAYGISTLYICQAHKDNGRDNKVHVAIDPNQSTEWQNVGMFNIERAGLAHLMTHRELSDHVGLPLSLQLGERFQFALIDGLHVFDYAIVDAFYVDLMLDVGGFVVFDDADMAGIAKAVDFFKVNRAYREVVPDDIGLKSFQLLGKTRMKMLRKISNDDRPWDHHIEF
jgi:predicted O-methyltransferase YrrM